MNFFSRFRRRQTGPRTETRSGTRRWNRPRDGVQRNVKRQYFEILAIVCAVLLVLTVVFAANLFGGSTSDNRLGDVLLERMQLEDRLARDYASQLSRTGGSNTRHLLAVTRQHLYGMQQINELAIGLYLTNGPMVPSEAISTAMGDLTECEDLINGGKDIDAPLSSLWEQLSIITQALAQPSA